MFSINFLLALVVIFTLTLSRPLGHRQSFSNHLYVYILKKEECCNFGIRDKIFININAFLMYLISFRTCLGCVWPRMIKPCLRVINVSYFFSTLISRHILEVKCLRVQANYTSVIINWTSYLSGYCFWKWYDGKRWSSYSTMY